MQFLHFWSFCAFLPVLSAEAFLTKLLSQQFVIYDALKVSAVDNSFLNVNANKLKSLVAKALHWSVVTTHHKPPVQSSPERVNKAGGTSANTPEESAQIQRAIIN